MSRRNTLLKISLDLSFPNPNPKYLAGNPLQLRYYLHIAKTCILTSRPDMMKLTLFLRLSAAIFVLVVLQSSTVTIVAFSFGKETSSSQHPRIEDEIGSPTPSTKRRDFLSQTTSAIVGTCTASLLPSSSLIGHPLAANALVDIEQPPSNNLLVQTYDKPRNDGIDKIFSNAMATGMAEYETKARPYKAKLFQTLFDSLALQNTNDNNIPTIVEVGMGTFPNAPYYAAALLRNNNKNPQLQQQLQGLDIVGVDPNNSMFEYAKESATRSGLISTDGGSNISLRNVHGVAEVLPFASNSIDAVGKLFLCSIGLSNQEGYHCRFHTPTYTHISLSLLYLSITIILSYTTEQKSCNINTLFRNRSTTCPIRDTTCIKTKYW